MMDFSNKKVSLILYVGSSEVSGILADVNSADKPIIYLSFRYNLEISKDVEVAEFPKLVGRRIRQIGDDIKGHKRWKQGEFELENIHCVFSSLWYSAGVRDISFKADEPFMASEEKVEEAVEQVKNDLQEEGVIDTNLLMEKKGVKVALNGYRVSNPYGKTASKLDITVFISALSTEIHKQITEKLADIFNERKVYFHSFLLASFVEIRKNFVDKESYLLMNLGGEITELCNIYDDAIQQINTFPLGLNHFVKAVMENTNEGFSESISELELFSEGELEDKKADKMGKNLKEPRQDWVGALSDTLGDMSESRSMPAVLFLNSRKEIQKWLSSVCKSEELKEYNLLEKPFDVKRSGNFQIRKLARIEGNSDLEPMEAFCASYVYDFTGLGEGEYDIL